MATKTVVCPECRDPVTYGRLSCPTCGALLASVAGGAVRPAPAFEPAQDHVAAPVEPAESSPIVEDVPLPPAARRASAAASRAASGGASAVRAAAAGARGAAAAVRSAAAGADTNTSEGAPVASDGRMNDNADTPAIRTPPRRRTARGPGSAAPPVLTDWPVAASMDAVSPNGHDRSDPPARQPTPGSLVPRAEMAARALGERAATLSAALATPLGTPIADSGGSPAWPSQPAGAYLPPSAVFVAKSPAAQAAQAIRARQVAAPGPPAGWRDGVAWPGEPPQPGAAAAEPPAAGSAPLLADLPFDVPTTIAGWLIAAGSGVAAVSFVLPWSSNVIGARGIGTYLDSWGLASPPSFIVFAITLAVLALAVVPNNVPVWMRTGLAGLLLGGLLVGLIWPYVVGGWADGPQVGVLGELAAGILLIAGGTMAQRPPRHEGDPTGV